MNAVPCSSYSGHTAVGARYQKQPEPAQAWRERVRLREVPVLRGEGWRRPSCLVPTVALPSSSVTETPALSTAAGVCAVLSGVRAKPLPGRGRKGELTVLTTSSGSNPEKRSGRRKPVLLFLFKVNCCPLALGHMFWSTPLASTVGLWGRVGR